MPIFRRYLNRKRTSRAGTARRKRARLSSALRRPTQYKPKATRRNISRLNLGKGLPKSVTMTHKFVYTYVTGGAAGALSNKMFYCNGMFQPVQSGVTHQPMFFDQLSAIYDHFTVVSAVAKHKIVNATSSTATSYLCAWVNDDTTVTPATINTIMEQPSAQTRIMTQSAGAPIYITQKWSAAANLGRPNCIGIPDLTGTAAANPTENSLFVISSVACDGTSSIVYDVVTEIEYTAVWTELHDIDQS